MALAMSFATNQRSQFDDPAFNADSGEEALGTTAPNIANALSSCSPANAAPGLNEKLFPIAFEFTWENSAFVAQLTLDTNSKDISAVISTDIGWLPFSAENKELRSHAVDFLKQHANGIHGKFIVSIAGRVTFTQKTNLGGIESRAEIIGALILCLLQARPYIKMVQSILR